MASVIVVLQENGSSPERRRGESGRVSRRGDGGTGSDASRAKKEAGEGAETGESAGGSVGQVEGEGNGGGGSKLHRAAGEEDAELAYAEEAREGG